MSKLIKDYKQFKQLWIITESIKDIMCFIVLLLSVYPYVARVKEL